MAVKETDAWAGQELAARRTEKNLTQEELAAKAGIDRSRLVGLENGRQRISPYYAEKLAPHLGIKDHRKLLPPPEQSDDPENPLARLARLEARVARDREAQLTFAEGVLARLAALEAGQVHEAQQSTPQEKPDEGKAS